MIDEVMLRPAEPSDANELFRLASILATSATPHREPFEHSLMMIIDDHNQRLVVAEHEAGLVGYLSGLVHPAFHANGNIGWIEELFVDQERRSRGIGRRLMDDFEAWARQTANARYFAVASRRAGDFYRAIGYQESAAYFKKSFER